MIRRCALTLSLALLTGASAAAQTPPPAAATAEAGSPSPDVRLAAAGSSASLQPRRQPVRDAPPALNRPEPTVRVRISGHLGFTSFAARESFQAVLDTNSGAVYGGGGGVLIGRHLFVDAQVGRFTADGERVFVTDDLQVFPLGIPATVTITPIDISVGWRFTAAPPPPGAAPGRRGGRRIVPFVGGGVGVLQYRETADFAEAGDDVDESFGSYHVLGGIELPITRRFGAAVDGLYRWVPDALGEGGVSAAYEETDLGGVTVRARVTFTF